MKTTISWNLFAYACFVSRKTPHIFEWGVFHKRGKISLESIYVIGGFAVELIISESHELNMDGL